MTRLVSLGNKIMSVFYFILMYLYRYIKMYILLWTCYVFTQLTYQYLHNFLEILLFILKDFLLRNSSHDLCIFHPPMCIKILPTLSTLPFLYNCTHVFCICVQLYTCILYKCPTVYWFHKSKTFSSQKINQWGTIWTHIFPKFMGGNSRLWIGIRLVTLKILFIDF